MNPYIEAINTYLAENMPKPGCGNVRSLLDMLYCCYSQHNLLETAEIRESSKALDKFLEQLPQEIRETFFEDICVFCEAQRRANFQEGILAGLLLFKEPESRAGGCA